MLCAQSANNSLVRVYALRPKIEYKKANDHGPVGNAIGVPSPHQKKGIYIVDMVIPPPAWVKQDMR